MRMNWVLPIACEDGSRVDFTKSSEAAALLTQADVVELGGEARFSVTVECVICQGVTPLVRFMPCGAVSHRIDWLRLNGWVVRADWSRSKQDSAGSLGC